MILQRLVRSLDTSMLVHIAHTCSATGFGCRSGSYVSLSPILRDVVLLTVAGHVRSNHGLCSAGRILILVAGYPLWLASSLSAILHPLDRVLQLGAAVLDHHVTGCRRVSGLHLSIHFVGQKCWIHRLDFYAWDEPTHQRVVLACGNDTWHCAHGDIDCVVHH